MESDSNNYVSILPETLKKKNHCTNCHCICWKILQSDESDKM